MTTEQTRRDVLKAGSLAMLGMTAAGGTAMGMMRSENRAAGMNPFEGAYADGEYTLPELPYPYDALAPVCEEQTLRIHHDRHHAGYVRGLNSTLAKLRTARDAGDYSSIKALSRDLAFNGSGHVLHTLFWHSMSPERPGMPDSLGEQLRRSFGSVDAAKNQFAAATKAVEGSGWGLLVYEPIADALLVMQAEKHQKLTMWGVVPLLVCDVWEHAYYLQYANNRGNWVDGFMEIANWPLAAMSLEQARMRRSENA